MTPLAFPQPAVCWVTADDYKKYWGEEQTMSTTLERIAERAPDATAPTVTSEQLALITRTVAKDATPDELKLYLYDCQRQGVHPLDKLLHFTKRGGKYTPVTSIDLMRIRAAETGEYAGSDDARFVELETHTGCDAATVTVWRLVQGQRCSFTATARWSEYCPAQGSDHMWRKMPHTMLAKCAEALALRKGFPRQLAGLYASEEMDQAQAPAPLSAAIPPQQERRENPAAATGETRGDLPPGYHRILDYRFKDGWHEIKYPDADGGTMRLSTKTLPQVGLAAKAAWEAGEYVAVTWEPKPKGGPGEGYLKNVAIYEPTPVLASGPIDDGDIPF